MRTTPFSALLVVTLALGIAAFGDDETTETTGAVTTVPEAGVTTVSDAGAPTEPAW